MKPISSEQMHYLSLDSTFADAELVLMQASEHLIPVVDTKENMALQVGCPCGGPVVSLCWSPWG
jgi:hypothetical protein